MFNFFKKKVRDSDKSTITSDEQKNIDLNSDGTTKIVELPKEESDSNIPIKLNEDLSQKSIESNIINSSPFALSDLVIKEVMMQKMCSRDEAIRFLTK